MGHTLTVRIGHTLCTLLYSFIEYFLSFSQMCVLPNKYHTILIRINAHFCNQFGGSCFHDAIIVATKQPVKEYICISIVGVKSERERKTYTNIWCIFLIIIIIISSSCVCISDNVKLLLLLLDTQKHYYYGQTLSQKHQIWRLFGNAIANWERKK